MKGKYYVFFQSATNMTLMVIYETELEYSKAIHGLLDDKRSFTVIKGHKLLNHTAIKTIENGTNKQA